MSVFPDRWARWSREVGHGMCFAALWCAVRAAPDGTDAPRLTAAFYLLVAVLLLYSGAGLARRERW